MPFKPINTVPPKGVRNESQKWDDITSQRTNAIAWNGAHSDSSLILSALIHVGMYPNITTEQLREEYDRLLNYFYDSRFQIPNRK